MRINWAYIILCFTTCLFVGNVLAQTDFWQPAGSDTLDVQALSIGDNDDIYIVTFDDGVFRSSDNGDSWTQVNNGITNLLGRAVAVGHAGQVYVGTDFGGVFRSADSGANWTENNTGLANLGLNVLMVNATGDIFAGTQGGVFRSTDDAESWTLVYEGNSSMMTTIIIEPVSGRMFAAGHTFVFALFGFSDNNGNTWSPISSFGPPNSSVWTLAATGNGDVYAGLNFGGIYKSVDNGGNWAEVNNGVPPNAEIRSLTTDDNGEVYAAVQQWGVLHSSDGGANWIGVNSGLPIGPIIGHSQALGVNSNGDIFLGTSQGVFRHVSTSTSVDGAELPMTTSLGQNYPNPFNPTTTISYNLAQSSALSLTVTDLLGRDVRVLARGTKPAGRFEVSFDGTDFPSGIYLYRLEAGDFVETKTMVIVK